MSRILLTVATTFVIDPAGSDTLGDGTAANPWQSPTGAYVNLQKNYDLGGINGHKIAPNPGTIGNPKIYDGLQATGPLDGQVAPLLFGYNPGNYASVLIRPPAGHGCPISLSYGAMVAINDLHLDAQLSNEDCIQVGAGCILRMSEIQFGQAPNNFHLDVGGDVFVDGFYAVTETGPSQQGHITVGGGGQVTFEDDSVPGSIYVNLFGELGWTTGFFCANGFGSVIQCVGTPINLTGGTTISANSPKFLLQKGGMFDLGGNDPQIFLPGTSAGANYGGYSF